MVADANDIFYVVEVRPFLQIVRDMNGASDDNLSYYFLKNRIA